VDRVGSNSLHLSGRLLTPGRYRLTAVALAGTLISRPVSLTFDVGL
jgi:hypothetical protein